MSRDPKFSVPEHPTPADVEHTDPWAAYDAAREATDAALAVVLGGAK